MNAFNLNIRKYKRNLNGSIDSVQLEDGTLLKDPALEVVEKTIDVSAYEEPIVIEPSSGKDGISKITITLSNIPD